MSFQGIVFAYLWRRISSEGNFIELLVKTWYFVRFSRCSIEFFCYGEYFSPVPCRVDYCLREIQELGKKLFVTTHRYKFKSSTPLDKWSPYLARYLESAYQLPMSWFAVLFIVWDDFICFSMLGREVMGIWPKNADKGDINCTDLSHHGSTLAIGDDFGFVKLYKFPCYDKSVSNLLHSTFLHSCKFFSVFYRILLPLVWQGRSTCHLPA